MLRKAPNPRLRARQMLGKYRIERRLNEGAFANVYCAMDTIEGVRVAIKVPHLGLLSDDMLADFRREVRLAAQLDHPNILPLKNADVIDERLVIAFSLGEETLSERFRRRMSTRTTLNFAEQLLEAVAYAHGRRIIHCDVKPDNIILFAGERLRLADFGISKVAARTIQASGSGTVGYMAPEQAMGRPSFRSDVFAVGLVVYRMLTGQLPEWPYDWPPPGIDRLRQKSHPELIRVLAKAMSPLPRNRYCDGEAMLSAFRRIKAKSYRFLECSKNKPGTTRRG